MSDGNLSHPGAEKFRRLRRRYREEVRFRSYGVAAILFAITSLCVLLVSIVTEAVSAFTRHDLSLELFIDPGVVDPTGERDPETIRANVSAFSDLIRGELRERFPEAAEDRDLRRQLARMVSTLSAEELAVQVSQSPELVGTTLRITAPLSDRIDLYLKGLVTGQSVLDGVGSVDVSRTPEAVDLRSQGGFAEAYRSLADRLVEEADGRKQLARVSEAAIARVDERFEALQSDRTELTSMDAGSLAEMVRQSIAIEGQDLSALSLAAGRAEASGDVQPFRTLLGSEFTKRADEAMREADELLARGDAFQRKALEAEARGEPNAETRRIQARTAYLAGDRRKVDASRLEDIARSVRNLDIGGLSAVASLVTSRPLTSLGRVVASGNEEALLPAVIEINQAEIVAAEAAVADQVARISGVEARVEALKSVSPGRAEALADEGLSAARSKLRRLERDLAVLQATRDRLASSVPSVGPSVDTPASTPAAAAIASDAPDATTEPAVSLRNTEEFLKAEAEAQLGLDLGGSIAAAYALGRFEGGAPGAEADLRALMTARLDRELEEVRSDKVRLERKRARDLKAATDLLSVASNPSAGIVLDEFSPTVLIEIAGGVVKAKRVSENQVIGQELIPLGAAGAVAAGSWSIREILVPEADRLVTDHQIVWADQLMKGGDIVRRPNTSLLTHADSTYPELAGLAAGLAGSFWIMLVTLILSLPVGVMAAIYLEEFAPRNWVTDFIEVNINNLAAVPSIVFGLLGAAVFINFFDLPRSSPLVGGLVLSLITLPTIIIATRAALGAVPPSIREGALAVGASLPQTVFHHVLPLAAPGVLTGAIIGLARALGETAPLLLIGMVAFVADPPESMLDSATALPVLVYKWSSGAERAWQPMTSAAIIILLIFMFAMNALAVYLRRRLERRW